MDRRLAVLAVVSLTVSLGIRTSTQQADAPDTPIDTGTDFICAIGAADAGFRALAAEADGAAVMFDQTPRILTADLTGSFSVQVQAVGDLPSIQFDRADPAAWGFDDGGMTWGSVVQADGARKALRLRIGSTNLPAATVIRLSPDVQYTRGVVNILVPQIDDEWIARGTFAHEVVARRFYEWFPDAYQVMSAIPHAPVLFAVSSDAYHRSLKNDVSGIGQDLFDRSASHGSGGTLLGVELFSNTSFASLLTPNHELTHQWAHYHDVGRLAGVEPKGHQPEGHAPLLVGPPSFVSATIRGTRQVVATDAGYEIRRSAFPILHHPLELYAMGKITAAALGPQLVVVEQGQFREDGVALPAPGTRVTGGIRELTVGALLGGLGARDGPSPGVLRRAIVLVSNDTLASQAEMNYWNFFAQRNADPERTGTPGFEGYVSFDRSSGNTVDLQTDIVTRAGDMAAPVADVSWPRFGRADWNGVRFTDTVPSRLVAGQRVTLSGQVTTTERSDYSEIRVRFRKSELAAEGQVLVRGDVSRSSAFSVDVTFTPAQRGVYSMEVVLVAGSGNVQQVRGILTPIVVE